LCGFTEWATECGPDRSVNYICVCYVNNLAKPTVFIQIIANWWLISNIYAGFVQKPAYLLWLLTGLEMLFTIGASIWLP